jgi:serine/threonine protein kinase
LREGKLLVLQEFCEGFSIDTILNEEVNWTCEMTVGFLVH